MEKIFGTYYDDKDFDSHKLPDNTDYLKAHNIFAYGSDEAREIGRRFRDRLAGSKVLLVGFNVGHNSGISLVEACPEQGIRVVANCEEERYAAVKHHAGYPEKCVGQIKTLLAQMGKTPEDIFCVLYAWNSVEEERYGHKMFMLNEKIVKNKYFAQISESATPSLEIDDSAKTKNIYNHSPGLANMFRRLSTDLELKAGTPCIQMLHHENHAYFSYGVSPFYRPGNPEKTTMISCIDGGGDFSSCSLYLAREGKVDLVKRIARENSLGVFYMLCATYLGGWSPLSSEGRYMGAAAWGNNQRLTNPYYKQLKQFFYFAGQGEVFINSTMTENENAVLQDIMGTFLPVEDIWNPDAVLNVDDVNHCSITRERVDKAAAVQMVFEDALFHIIGWLIHETQSDQLVMCGGTALNCVANMRLLQHFNDAYYRRYLNKDTRLHIWIPPVPSDQGVVAGAPYQFAMRNRARPQGSLPTPFLCGLPVPTQDLLQAFDQVDFVLHEKLGNINDPKTLDKTADWMAYAVARNAVIGIYQGEAETGPRALGHRSFLANPCHTDTLKILNDRVKHRERIRPLAPMVTLEAAHKWFKLAPGAQAHNYNAYDYMVLTVEARQAARTAIPAVIHYDGTSRIQIVRPENNPLMHRYLQSLGKYTGAEVSVNTSLNIGSPIVQDPFQALDLFKRARGLDAIFMIGSDGDIFMAWAKEGVQTYTSNILELRQDFQAGKMMPSPKPEPLPAQDLKDPRQILRALKANQISVAETKLRLKSLSSGKKESNLPAIAVIGISGVFPDAENVDQFWQNLKAGRDSIRQVPRNRGWDIADFYDKTPRTPGKAYVTQGGFLRDIDCFDPLFFGISPSEAQLMDPSERLFLQEAWRAIEDAGYAASSLNGKPWGVFACAKGDYPITLNQSDHTHLTPSDSFPAARLSYFLNLVGPALSLDTACSSTLTAIAYACDSLALGNCEVAVAGGGSVYTTPNMLIASSQSLLLSPDCTCYAFDGRANGTVFGEAVGAMVLKPLDAAIRDRDPIHGVIRGWGTNQDGKTNGMLAPSAASQTRLQSGIYRKFNINPEQITMVEGHGTGTKLGDTVEMEALNDSFGQFTAKTGYCALGSVKTNIGHAFFGSGIAGMFKVLESLKHGQIPPTLHFESINPHIALDKSSFFINTTLRAWQSPENQPRCAAINSFGATGINVHLVVEQAPRPLSTALETAPSPTLVPLSARNKERLQVYAKNLLAFVRQGSGNLALRNLAYTLQKGREAMEERLCLMVDSLKDLENQLQNFIEGHPGTTPDPGHAQLKELMKRWLKGKTVDWDTLWQTAGDPPSRIRLPGYPFAKMRCWAGKASEPHLAASDLPDAHVLKEDFFVDGCLGLTPKWEVSRLPDDAPLFPEKTASLILAGGNENQVSAIAQLYPNARSIVISPGDTPEQIADILRQSAALDHLVWMAPQASGTLDFDTLATDQETGVLVLFRLVKAVLSLGYGVRDLGWTLITFGSQPVTPKDPGDPTHAAVHGLAGSLAKEYPHWRVRLLDMEAGTDIPVQEVFHTPAHSSGDTLARRGNQWFKRELVELSRFPKAPSAYCEKGVYLVIGGAGGLGEVWSRYMIQAFQAQIIWIGRRPKDNDIQAKIDALAHLGPAPGYIRADAADPPSLQRAYEKIKQQYPRIHGIVHSAMDLLDQGLANMDEARFRAGLGSKLDTSVRITQVFGHEPLDFMLFFSSMQSFRREPGQSNYAAGCVFQDAFARRLAREFPWAVKTMNWGYWGSAGRVAGPEYRLRMEQAGIGSIESAQGMEALENLVQGPLDQMAFIKPLDPNAPFVREMNITEQITVSSETLLPCIENMEKHLPVPLVSEHRFKAATAFENPDMNRLLLQLLHGTFQELNLLEAATLPPAAGRPAFYDQWFAQSRKILDNTPTRLDALDLPQLWAQWDQARTAWMWDKGQKARVVLAQACLRALPDILSGKKLATDVMFPDSSMDLVNGIYQNNPVADLFNHALAQTLVACLEERRSRDPNARFRILEIGAGTGASTSGLLPLLQPFSMDEYCYTDLSKAFLLHAQEKFARQNPYLTTAIFDVEAPIAGQGITPCSFDFVIASNVLHATENIRHTLRNAKAPLKKNGVLLLNELNEAPLFVHLTFGLLEGWWLYEDELLRIPGCPGLTRASWSQVLGEEGFEAITFPARQAHGLGHSIIAAQSDGIIRQQLQSREAPVKKEKTKERTTVVVQQPSPAPEHGHVIAMIVESLVDILKVPRSEIKNDIPFSDYGVDSILGVSFIRQVNKRLGIDMNTTILFDYTTVDRLAAHITENSGLDDIGEKAPATTIPFPPNKPKTSEPRIIEPVASITAGGNTDDIAVIGISGLFPGAADVNAFWDNLIKGADCVGELPDHYLDTQLFFAPQRQPGKTYCRWGGILAERDYFDPLFFNISPRQAHAMSPHQRLILQESWKGLEDAGYNPKSLADTRTSLFIGAEPTGFQGSFTGSSDAIVASRLSYYLNLKGPALVVNSGCSSSGVAIHLACESLRNNESDMAIAGGVFADLAPPMLVTLSQVEMLSPTGRCRAFDQAADGTVFGEGAGIAVLKRLKDAVADGDAVYAVIKGSGMNQDGASNGIAAPNGAAQQALIADIYQRYRINPEDITYIEAHGTATKLGDPVEANALVRAFRQFTPKTHFCAVGSAKSHIGHCAASSGIIGLIKILLSMKHCQIPGQLHFQKLNPLIEFQDSAFYVTQTNMAWQRENGRPLMAALNSFGHSGTNVHLVVEAYKAPHIPSQMPAHPFWIPLSAKTGEGLVRQAENLLAFLENAPDTPLPQLAYTLETGREPMKKSAGFPARDIAGLTAQLKAFLSNPASAQTVAPRSEAMNWPAIFSAGAARRLHLPTYPFAREAYGMAQAPSASEPGEPEEARETAAQIVPAAPDTRLPKKIQKILIDLITQSLEIKTGSLDVHDELSEFGFDSIEYLRFSDRLNALYPLNIDPTIFFEYPTIAKLSEYLSAGHGRVFSKETGEKPPPRAARPISPPAPAVPAVRIVPGGSAAVIGMSGCFPGARDIAAFWRNLEQGKESITQIPPDRWDWQAIFGDPALEKNKTNIKWGGFMDGVKEFDSLFFGISPREAELMDPQQRLLMTHVWQAMEDAGYCPDTLSGTRTGIFVATADTGYSRLIDQAGQEIDGYSATGVVPSMGPSRMSFYLNLHGPSEPIETACSSSLVAIHKALIYMEAGMIDMAFVGGVNTIVIPDPFISFAKAGALSPDGHCKTFSKDADGYVRGEGAGILFLKKTELAEQDNDHIYGLVRGSAENHGGRSNSLTAPNPKAQAELLKTAWQKAGIDPATLGYIEAHGTGTKLGDPIEIKGLKAAFADNQPIEKYGEAACGLGSVKTNIGHLELASGVAGVIKVLLQMKHKTLVKSLHSSEVNPMIHLENSPLYIVREKSHWPAPQTQQGLELPRRAGVSSFGIGGVNAHVVIEEYPDSSQLPGETEHDPHLVVLSARNADRLKEMAVNLKNALPLNDKRLADIAFTLQTGREAMEERLGLIIHSQDELVEKLKDFINGQKVEGLHIGSARDNGEALSLFDEQDMAGIIDKWIQQKEYSRLLGLWVKGMPMDWHRLHVQTNPCRVSLPCYPFERKQHWILKNGQTATGLITRNTQVPHSQAAPTLHPLLHENTSTLAEQRFSSRFTGREFFFADHVVKMSPTGPGQKVLPGVAWLEMARAAAERALGRTDFRLKSILWTRPITGETPRVGIRLFYPDSPSPGQDIGYQIYTSSDAGEQVHGQGKVVMNGNTLPPPDMDIAAMAALCNPQNTMGPEELYPWFRELGIEYGPGFRGIQEVRQFQGANGIKQILAKLALPEPDVAPYILHPCLLDCALQASLGLTAGNAPVIPFALEALEIHGSCVPKMWVWIRPGAGQSQTLDLDLCDPSGKIKVSMKGYASRPLSLSSGAGHPLLTQIQGPEPEFLSKYTGREFFLKDHGQMVPGVVYLEMARAAAQLESSQQAVGLKNVVWNQPLYVPDQGREQEARTRLTKEGNSAYSFQISTRNPSGTAIHAQGKVLLGSQMPPAGSADLREIKSRCVDSKTREACDRLLESSHGPSLMSIEELRYNDREALARLGLPDMLKSDKNGYALHPSLMNGVVLGSVLASLLHDKTYGLSIPFALARMQLYGPSGPLPEELYAHVKPAADHPSSSNRSRRHDIDLMDDTGRILVSMKGFTTMPLPPASPQVIHATPQWRPSPLEIPPGARKDGETILSPIFILNHPNPRVCDALEGHWPHARVETLPVPDGGDEAEFIQTCFLHVFKLIQDCFDRPRPLLFLTDDQHHDYRHAPIAALFRTAALENPKIKAKMIRFAALDQEDLPSLLENEMQAQGVFEIRYTDDKVREIKGMAEIEDHTLEEQQAPLAREGDVIWMTGGLGGVGRVIAQRLAKVKGVKLILSGRSPLDEEKQTALDSLKAQGIDALYFKSDVSQKQDVQELVHLIVERYGALNGILHTAGVIQDAYILKKTEQEIRRVFQPKTAGALAIHQATRSIELDYLVFFSSLAGTHGNPGQADYAGANAFLDAFALWRNQEVAKGLCHGKTLSVNWPLWKEGGMAVDPQMERLMEQTTGMTPLDSQTGFDALGQAVAGNQGQRLVLQGTPEKIRNAFLHAGYTPSTVKPVEIKEKQDDGTGDTPSHLLDAVQEALVQLAADLQRIDPAEINLDTDLPQYGFDSIGLTGLTNRLNREYGLELMPTLFFEHTTLESLAHYLIQHHPDPILAKHTPEQTQSPAPESEPKPEPFPPLVRRFGARAQVSQDQIMPGQKTPEPIAVIGMSGRFPGSKNLAEFWRHLEANADLITEIPEDRWDWRALYGEPGQGKTKIKWGGFINDVHSFDPLFFGISPLEAEAMDPQFRLLAETVWSVVEDAGYRASTLAGSKTGLFTGVSTMDYRDLWQRQPAKTRQRDSIGLYPFIIANRISFLFDLRGPSEVIDTACSSSLVALHRAIESMRQGSCDTAVVGGVNLILDPDLMLGVNPGILSQDGRCRTFDAKANGYVRGEGVGAVFLKPQDRALKDGDRIHGLILGSAENHGGKAASPTAPNPSAQEALLVDAYQRAGVDPGTISYVEAHGTGTNLGDPIEIEGLKGGFAKLFEAGGRPAPETAYCALGSVKANIGHLEAAAGISGLIKTLLMLKHKKIPGNPHLDTPNPYLKLTDSPFFLQKETTDWHPPAQMPRRAGVSSFGIGGTNAHIILEEAPAPENLTEKAQGPCPIVLSAKTREQLHQAARNLGEFIRQTPVPPSLADIAHTLDVGREPMPKRLAFMAASLADLAAKLDKFLASEFSGQSVENAPGDWARGACRISLPTYPFARERCWALAEPETHPIKTQMWRPVWQNTPLSGKSCVPAPARQVITLEPSREPSDASLATRYQAAAVQAFEAIKKTMETSPSEKILLQFLVFDPLFQGLSGLLKTATQENPNILTQLIEVPPGLFPDNLARENSQRPYEVQIRYRDGQRQVMQWEKADIPADPTAEKMPWKQGGTYLITGGAGGLGLIFARDIAAHTHNVTLILAGRSPLSPQKEARIKQLEDLGARVVYQRADISVPKDVADLMVPGLNGIIHAAGVIHDAFIWHKTTAQFDQVLRPKVAGTLLLDEASRHLPLDFFILFSSGTSVLGNPGQADYAAANGFMDFYSGYRKAHNGPGKTLCINWPLWKEGGMAVGPEIEAAAWERMGTKAMDTASGIRALHRALAGDGPASRFMVIHGLEQRIQPVLAPETMNLPGQADVHTVRPGTPPGKNLVQQLRTLLADFLKLAPERIEPDEPFEIYGINSHQSVQLTQKLETIYGDVSKTIFFECKTLNELAEHLSRQSQPAAAACRDEIVPDDAVQDDTVQDGVAIIGISGRYPKAPGLDNFQKILSQGQSVITTIPEDRWNWRRTFEATGSKWGGFLDDCHQFDSLFFNITPLEAAEIDPQERLFLEECWKAMEDAGYTPSKFSPELRSKTGVFAGMTKQGFNLTGLNGSLPATSFSSLVNRVSYHMDLQGPSLAVDTMCSSSLVAIHEACEYLRLKGGELAVAGGVNLYLHPSTFQGLAKGQLLSSQAHCAAFAKGGNGFVPGEGVGAVLLKPLSLALRDQDHIYAVIRGTAVNHSGKTNGYTVPNPNQLTSVIRQALDQGRVDPRTVSYVECAANGSQLGDAIEMTALSNAFADRAGVEGDYRIGSLKPNIGHGESVSGMSQLSKVVLGLKNHILFPTLLHGDLNPNIRFDRLPFQVQQDLAEWQPVKVDGIQAPRRACITGIGAGGVNACLILEEALPPRSHGEPVQGPYIFILSAKTQERLAAYKAQWIAYLQSHPGADLANICYTLQTGRREMAHRLAVVCQNQTDLLEQLDTGPVFRDIHAHHNQMAQSWAQGQPIPWETLNPGSSRVRLPGLPVYPFERKQCRLGPGQPLKTKGIDESLTGIFSRVAGLTPHDLQSRGDFQELGINSVNAVELVAEINKVFSLSLPPAMLSNLEP